jgi:hypothetical protein
MKKAIPLVRVFLRQPSAPLRFRSGISNGEDSNGSWWLPAVVGTGILSWRLWEDWHRLSDMLKSIVETKPDLKKIIGTRKTKDRARRLSEMQNLYETLAKGDNEDAFDCCVNLLSYYADGDEKDAFLALPHLYMTRVTDKSVFNSGSREREAASHYSIYTRDICLTYFLHNGHIITYVQYLIKQQLFEVLLFGGFTVVVKNGPSLARKAREMIEK